MLYVRTGVGEKCSCTTGTVSGDRNDKTPSGQFRRLHVYFGRAPRTPLEIANNGRVLMVRPRNSANNRNDWGPVSGGGLRTNDRVAEKQSRTDRSHSDTALDGRTSRNGFVKSIFKLAFRFEPPSGRREEKEIVRARPLGRRRKTKKYREKLTATNP